MSQGGARRIALKVDCDTFEGTKDGLPNLLRLFDKFGIRASFYFTLGPDRSGRAVARVFTRKGFLKKMLRSKALKMYPAKTLMYGTLLPAPMIGERLAPVIKSVGDAGHEVGVHAWDHIKWHDRCVTMPEEELAREYGLAHREFEQIFGARAKASAAPGWQASAGSLAVQDRYGMLYASNTRLGGPFFPEVSGRRFLTLEIPTTLPTWDEMYNAPELADASAFIEYYRKAVRGTEVHSIHTEVEATALLALFERQLEAWRADGVEFVTMDTIARETLVAPERVPGRHITRITLPGRAGEVTGSAPL